MAKKNKNKKIQLSAEGKTELAKTIAEKGQTFAKTYEHFEIRLGKIFRWGSGWLDKILFHPKHGKLVALILALLLYVSFNFPEEALFENIKNAEDLGTFPVTAIVSDQAYEVSNLPQSVQVRVIGDLSDIKNIKQRKSFRVVANLTDLTEGTHEVKLKTESAPSSVEVVLEPSNAIVTIKKKSIRSFTLGYDFTNRGNMDSIYDLGEPQLEQGEVHVRASNDTLDSIAYVKALIDIKTSYTSDFTTQATIAAYDDKGNKMDVDIIPETMNATVKVTRPSKEVPVTIVPNGTIANDKAIASYTLDHAKVTLYAEQSVLDSIHELPITIPASTLTSDREFSMPLIPPYGVTKISESVVNISVKLDAKKERVIEGVPIEIINVKEGLNVSLVDAQTVSVTVQGAEKVIKQLKAEDLKVEVDLSKNDASGEFSLPLQVKGKNPLVNYVLKNAETTVRVSEE